MESASPYPDNDAWSMAWTVTCDGCGAVAQVTTQTAQPDSNTARREMIRQLEGQGWSISTYDNCPSCRNQGGYLPTSAPPLPPASSEHYMTYSSSEGGITVRCNCNWQAHSPGMAGATMAADAHRDAAAGRSEPPGNLGASATEWWNHPDRSGP
jgi:hypothetical protein